MNLVAFIINLLILVVVLAIVYLIAQAIITYLAVPWGDLALKVIGLLCLLAVAVFILQALVGGAPAIFPRWGSDVPRLR